MSPVLALIAERYRASRAGRTGSGQRDLIFPFNDLLGRADSRRGPARHEAVQALEHFEAEGFLILERSRDRSEIFKVRLPLTMGEAFFARLGQSGPEEMRRAFSVMIAGQAAAAVPEDFKPEWQAFCRDMSEAGRQGASVAPLEITNLRTSLELLEVTAKVLGWKGESYLRFASCVLCKDSKRLGQLSGSVERLLARITHGRIQSLADLGITESGGGCWVHGPGALVTRHGRLDLGALELPMHLSKTDLTANRLESSAPRWMTVENETMLLELAKLRGGVLLLSSGFRGGVPNSTVIEVLKSAPEEVELWHFGDSDPKGFDILRDLRERSERVIRSLEMHYRPASDAPALSDNDQKLIKRLLNSDFMEPPEKAELASMLSAGNKGRFEQESLGVPELFKQVTPPSAQLHPLAP